MIDTPIVHLVDVGMGGLVDGQGNGRMGLCGKGQSHASVVMDLLFLRGSSGEGMAMVRDTSSYLDHVVLVPPITLVPLGFIVDV